MMYHVEKYQDENVQCVCERGIRKKEKKKTCKDKKVLKASNKIEAPELSGNRTYG